MQDLISNCFTEGQVGEEFRMCFLGISVCSFRQSGREWQTNKHTKKGISSYGHGEPHFDESGGVGLSKVDNKRELQWDPD